MRSARAKYASLGVEKSKLGAAGSEEESFRRVVKGGMPSNVFPSGRHAVYLAHSKLIHTVLKPWDWRLAKNSSASASFRFPIIACGDSPAIRNGTSF